MFPHLLDNKLNPHEEVFHVVQFGDEKITQNGDLPIVVGGTGFYIQALLYDIDFTESNEDSAYREELEQIAKDVERPLHEELRKVDEKSADEFRANNVKRVIRALEFFKQTGQKISEHNDRTCKGISRYAFCLFCFDR